jgi:multiple sugar transport system permease protein
LTQKSDRRLALLLLLPLTVFTAIFGLYPLAYTIAASFTPYTVGKTQFVFAGLVNYTTALASPFFTNSVMTTFIISAAAVAIELLFGLALALLLHERFRGAKLFRVALLFPMMTPPIVVGVIWKTLLFPTTGPFAALFSDFGYVWPNILATIPGARLAVVLMDVWEYTPFVMLIILAGLQSMPSQVVEAAEVDGARSFTVFRYITLPFILPVIIVASIFRLLTAAKMFDAVYVLTLGGPSYGTDTISLFVQRTFVFDYQLSYASASSLLFMLVMFVLAFLLARTMRRSLR